MRGAAIADALREVGQALAAAGIEAPQDEARRLVAAALGWSSATLLSRREEALAPAQSARLDAMLRRRVVHEPLSRILGEREFYGRRFEISPATLDPRPDSETLIAAALELMGAEVHGRDTRLLDLGTGSGCLLVTLLAEIGDRASGVGTDISPDALGVARRNADALGLAARARFIHADLAEGVAGPFDLIVSNPPYIASAEVDTLDASVRLYDPRLALDGGPDGLVFYRRIAQAAPVLAAGWVVLEVGHTQAQAVADLLAGAGFTDPRTFKDVAGRIRVVAARSRKAR